MNWTSISTSAAAIAEWLRLWWPWLVVVAIPPAFFGAWWLWWWLPKRQVDRLRMTVRDAKARADIEDNFRKTIGQLLGGAAVLLGAGLAYLQFQGQQQAAHNLLIGHHDRSFDRLAKRGWANILSCGTWLEICRLLMWRSGDGHLPGKARRSKC